MKLIPEQTAFIFPGQGSQTIGMGKELTETYPVAEEIYKRAEKLLGFPLSRFSWDGPQTELDDTINTQPALFVHSVASLQVFKQIFPSFSPAFVAGHSLGEFSALVACESLSFEDGLGLVRTRGELMKKAGENQPGGMAAILGMENSLVEELCDKISKAGEMVQIANDNCPGQIVVSGTSRGIDQILENAKSAGAKRVVRLNVSIAAHSSLMVSAQDTFSQVLRETNFHPPSIPIIGNITARPLENIQAVRNDLQNQLTNRVRWTETIQTMRSKGIQVLLELGSGSVLTGLLRRIDRDLTGISLSGPTDFKALMPQNE